MGIQTNFDFLKENYADLLQLALLAERNCYSDPSTSLSKLRILSEKLAIILIDIEQLEDAYDNRQIMPFSMFWSLLGWKKQKTH